MTDKPGRHGRFVHSVDDAMALLDLLFDDAADRWTERGGTDFWDRFYADRGRGVPFFRWAPDESLVRWHAEGRLELRPGTRVLELGCGPGRNAVWFAQQGCPVDALDLSGAGLDWGRERATEADVDVTFVQTDIFGWAADEPYDVVYDSGCFHHLPPHRRPAYRHLLETHLAPGGVFGIACFAKGGMGDESSDLDVYRAGSLGGGLAYSDEDLRRAFDWLTEVDLTRMASASPDSPVFGEDFLWAGLFRR